MRTFRLLGLASLFCLISLASLPQQPVPSTSQPPQRDPQAVALIKRSPAAPTGGVPVADVPPPGPPRRIAGSDDETGAATLKATALGDSRIDLVFHSGTSSEI